MKMNLKPVVCLGASVISWVLGAQEVKIKSSIDGTLQPCFVQAPAEGLKNVPLLVGLHSWSTSYTSAHPRDFMAKECAERGWAFVYPHFRGPNKNPDACGSEKAVADVLDAVAWAQKEFDIDAKRIYIAGGSGGGEEPEYPEWKPWDGISKDYQKGAIVSHNGELWESVYDGQNVWQPGAPGTENMWVKYTPAE